MTAYLWILCGFVCGTVFGLWRERGDRESWRKLRDEGAEHLRRAQELHHRSESMLYEAKLDLDRAKLLVQGDER